ncbi:MAG TPA: TetR/AcrR family transcriptional regulator [Stellaceae bacterium]|nr:TetR/AcrR family transcriptional regulator [Stellaceae bacterium]
MADSPRWRRRKEARPDEILEAALAEFAARGFAAARLHDIAAAAGITKGTLYLYFPSKEELFKAVVRGTILPRVAALEAVVEAAEAPAAVLLASLIQRWSELLQIPQICAIPKLVLSESGNFPDLARFYYDEVITRGLGLVRGLLRRGVAAGEFRPIDVDYAAFSVIGPLLLSMLWRHSLEPNGAAPLDGAALARSHADLLLRALSMEGRP